MIASDIMTEDPQTLRTDNTLADAVEVLQSLAVRHVPVVNDAGELVGMLSDRDLRSLAIDTLRGDEPIGTVAARARAPVLSLMSSDVISINPDTQVEEIIDLMLENKIGAVPVVNGEGAIVGIVSYVDILRQWPSATS